MALFVWVEVGTDDGGEQAAGRVNLKEGKKTGSIMIVFFVS